MKSLDELHERRDELILMTQADPRNEEAWDELKSIVNQIKNYR